MGYIRLIRLFTLSRLEDGELDLTPSLRNVCPSLKSLGANGCALHLQGLYYIPRYLTEYVIFATARALMVVIPSSLLYDVYSVEIAKNENLAFIEQGRLIPLCSYNLHYHGCSSKPYTNRSILLWYTNQQIVQLLKVMVIRYRSLATPYGTPS